jgi:hypothetical protein
LRQKDQQQARCDALGQIEAKAAETGEPVSHRDLKGCFQSNCRRWTKMNELSY